jgi:hypothetical protein
MCIGVTHAMLRHGTTKAPPEPNATNPNRRTKLSSRMGLLSLAVALPLIFLAATLLGGIVPAFFHGSVSTEQARETVALPPSVEIGYGTATAASSPGWIVYYQAIPSLFSGTITYAWTLDGSSVGGDTSGVNVTLEGGTHTIGVTVTDSNNDDASATIVAHGGSHYSSGSPAPLVHICYTCLSGPGWNPLAISFVAGDWTSVSGFTNPVSYSTDITPGSHLMSGTSWTYTFGSSGTYTLTTTATDAHNNVLTDTVTVTVS